MTLGGLCLLFTFVYSVYRPTGDVFGHYFWMLGVVAPLYVVAVWLVRLRPEHPQAQRMLLAATGFTAGAALEAFAASAGDPRDWSWAWLLNLLHLETSMLATSASGALMASYPDGRVERRWHRVAVRVIWWQMTLPLLVHLSSPDVALSPYLFDHRPGTSSVRLESPLFVPALEPVGPVLEAVLTAWAAALLGVVVLLARLVRADAATRHRMRLLLVWLAVVVPVTVGYVVLQALGVPSTSMAYLVVESLTIPVVLMVPVSIVVGVLRHQLFDIDVAVHRSLLYGAVVAVIALVYVVLASAPGLALGDAVPVQLAVVLTVVVALLTQPLRRRLETLADRWAYGERVNRYQLLSSFGAGLEKTVDLAELLPRLASTVRAGLRAEWVRVSLVGDRPEVWLEEPRGTAGVPEGEPALVQELRHGEELVGVIECGPRLEGSYDDADRQLVATLSRQAATAIANVRLAARQREQLDELARSRARIVAVQDEERRRLERDIHDGVQQEVVALIAKLRLARNRLGRGEPPDELLAELQSDAGELLVDLRELAHGIHPPVLSDGGLVAAVEARASRLPLAVAVRSDEGMRGRRFDPDVEAAAYYVVCEALTNVLKHAHVEEAEVDLGAVDGHLTLRVHDGGPGTAVVNGHGHGLTNLRDRVEALGGEMRVDSRAGAGTAVAVDLPAGDLG